MSFCSKCGAEITSEGNFCQKCGAQINVVTEIVTNNNGVTEQQRGSVKNLRNESLAEIQNVYNYFIKKIDAYNQFGYLNSRINSFPGRKKRYVSAIGIVGMIIIIFVSFKGMNGSNMVVSFINGFIAVLTTAASIFTSIKLKKINNKEIKERDSINLELINYYNAYNNCPIGIEFSNPNDIKRIMDTIRCGRAETISAAINIVLDDDHKANMERRAGEIAWASAEAAKAAKTAARNSFFNLYK